MIKDVLAVALTRAAKDAQERGKLVNVELPAVAREAAVVQTSPAAKEKAP